MTLTLVRSDFEYFVLTPDIGLLAGAYFRKQAIEIPPFVSPVMNWVVREDVFAEQGVTAGFLDADVAFIAPERLSGASQQVGLVCLQSHRVMGGISTSRGYGFHFDAINARLNLRKYSGGLRTYTTLFTATNLYGNPTSTPPPSRLGLLWIVDPQLQWTLLIAYHGLPALNSFAEVARYQDFDTPYTDGIAEGGFYDDGGSANPYYFGFTRAVLYGQRYGILVEPSLAKLQSTTPQIS